MVAQSGIIEEMLDDTMESLDDDELEEEADAEVDKVLFDLTDGKLGQAGAVGADLPVSLSLLAPKTIPRAYPIVSLQAHKEAEEDINDEAEMQRMQKELHDLLAG
jgi:charged multivesicular body protein 3